MNVIAITSGKGGVGKTSLASGLAVSLQNTGARVLVIDADLGLADMNIAFNVRPAHSLRDVIDGSVAIADAIVETPCGVKLLPAYAGSFDLANLDEHRRMGLLHAVETLQGSFDTIIIDTGAGIGATAMTFAAAASQIIVVTTRELASMADAYATMKVLSQRFAVKSVRLLVNMVETAADAQVAYETIELMARRFLQLRVELVGYVCRDAAIPAAWRQGVPFVVDRPTAPASHCLRVLACRLRDPEEGGNRGVSFWRRLAAAAEVVS
ncbi:MAG: AAA family ATPase [Deltaproteobacteria bacterium]|nr:AAA family ATPase [Deltaproteobacteria bacterium]